MTSMTMIQTRQRSRERERHRRRSIDRRERIRAQLCGLICKIHIHPLSAMLLLLLLLRQRACRFSSDSWYARKATNELRNLGTIRSEDDRSNFVKLTCRRGVLIQKSPLSAAVRLSDSSHVLISSEAIVNRDEGAASVTH